MNFLIGQHAFEGKEREREKTKAKHTNFFYGSTLC
jgi:hypothetical protein